MYRDSIEGGSGCKIFGAFRAFSGIRDIIPILHAPIGCYWGVMYHQIAQDESSLRGITSSIHDKDVVFGGEEKLVQVIEMAKKYCDEKKIAILGCCVSSIIGDDIEAIREQYAPDSLYVDAAGFKGKEWEGYEEALLSLLPLMKEEQKSKDDKRVNVIGFDTVSPKARADVKEIRRLLTNCGYEINAVLSLDTTLEQIEKMPCVEKNILIGGYGLRLAEAMKKEFGTPYVVVDAPYGSYLTKEFLEKATDNHSIYEENVMEHLERAYRSIQRMYEMPVAIVADYARATALTKFMEVELGCDVHTSAVTSGSPIHPDIQNLFEVNNLLRNADLGNDRLRLILGTSFQKRVALELDVALIRVSYPTHDDISLYDGAPYMGYRGLVVMIEKILNMFWNKYPEEGCWD